MALSAVVQMVRRYATLRAVSCSSVCCAMLCYAVRCGAVPCRAVPCVAVRCGAGGVPCRALRCGAVRCGAVLCCAVLCCAVCHGMAHSTAQQNTEHSTALPRTCIWVSIPSAKDTRFAQDFKCMNGYGHEPKMGERVRGHCWGRVTFPNARIIVSHNGSVTWYPSAIIRSNVGQSRIVSPHLLYAVRSSCEQGTLDIWRPNTTPWGWPPKLNGDTLFGTSIETPPPPFNCTTLHFCRFQDCLSRSAACAFYDACGYISANADNCYQHTPQHRQLTSCNAGVFAAPRWTPSLRSRKRTPLQGLWGADWCIGRLARFMGAFVCTYSPHLAHPLDCTLPKRRLKSLTIMFRSLPAQCVPASPVSGAACSHQMRGGQQKPCTACCPEACSSDHTQVR